jgi:hypothetical protein
MDQRRRNGRKVNNKSKENNKEIKITKEEKN